MHHYAILTAFYYYLFQNKKVYLMRNSMLMTLLLCAPMMLSAADVAAPAENPTDGGYDQMLESFLKTSEEKMQTRTYRCRHVSAETVRRLLENFISPAGIVARSDEDDFVVVSDVESRMTQIDDIVKQADRPVPQVLVEARIVEFELTDDFAKDVKLGFAKAGIPSQAGSILGSMAGAPDLSKETGITKLNGVGANTTGELWSMVGNDKTKFWMAMKYLQTKNYGRLLSAPNLIIRRGANGSINTGEKVPITVVTGTGDNAINSTRYENVGVKLTVQPVMISGEQVRLKITPEASSVNRYQEGTGAPYINTRSLTTEMEMTSGELIILGGLLQNENRMTKYEVPYLSKIPLLGWFFRGETSKLKTSQLVVFITPYILTPGNKGERDAMQRGVVSGKVRDNVRDVEQNMRQSMPNLWEPMPNLDILTSDQNPVSAEQIFVE